MGGLFPALVACPKHVAIPLVTIIFADIESDKIIKISCHLHGPRARIGLYFYCLVSYFRKFIFNSMLVQSIRFRESALLPFIVRRKKPTASTC